MILSVENTLQDLPTTPYSYLSANVSAAGTALGVKNINPFTANWAIQLGKTGESQSEILNISGAPASGTVNTATSLLYAHNIDTPVYQIHYDQIIFERSTTGTAGTAVAIGTVNITPNSFYTEFNDATGTTTYAYKTKFYNSVSTDVSTESDWFVPGGPTFYSLQSMRQRVKDSLYNSGYVKDDGVLNGWINEWVEQMTNSAIKVNEGYSVNSGMIAFGTSSMGTVTDPLFKGATKLQITFDGVHYTNSHEIPENRFDNNDTFSALYPNHYWHGDTVFGVLPQGNAGTAVLTYSVIASPLVNDSDELPTSLRSYTTSCIEYTLYKAFDNDLKKDYADDHYTKFLKNQNDFIAQVTPRDATGVKTIDMTDPLSGGQDTVDLISDFII